MGIKATILLLSLIASLSLGHSACEVSLNVIVYLTDCLGRVTELWKILKEKDTLMYFI